MIISSFFIGSWLPTYQPGAVIESNNMGFYTALAATAVSATGTYMEGQAKADAARGQAELGRHNAVVTEKDAIATEAKTRFDQIRQVLSGERTIATMRAFGGASGALVSAGASMHAIAQQLSENELQNALIGHAGRTQADRLRSKAAGFRAGAVYADAQAKNIGTATLLNTGKSFLGSVGAMYDKGMFTSKTPSVTPSTPSFSPLSSHPSFDPGEEMLY
jgi:hypothetical protein